MRSLPACLVMMIAVLSVVAWLGSSAVVARAAELDDEVMPVFQNDDDYTLVVTNYKATSEADLLKGDAPEYEFEIKTLLNAPKDVDVLCFQTEMQVKSAQGDRGKDLLVAKRGKQGKEYAAVLPRFPFEDKRGKPLSFSPSELKGAELRRPAYEVKRFTVEVNAVLVEKRESKEVPAIVADRLIDIGHDTEVQVTAMEVSQKGVMKVNMKVRRPPGTRAALVDSVFALDDDGDVVGGGRWTNELELFDRDYDVELEFELKGKPTIEKLRVVLATKYELKPIQIEVEGLFQR